MGFRVKLEMQITDAYTADVRGQIQTALGQFVQQYNTNVSDCSVQIIPDLESITLVAPQEEDTPMPEDNNLNE